MAEEQSTGGEFEREPVPESALKGPGKFWGMYAGEHAAGTEFMIGPLFLGAGASLQDLIVGLLLGNILAVLTWRFLVTPIAMAKRMTLYYQLERIAGGSVVKLYNAVNGVLFCFLAGAMITVSATATGVPLGVEFAVPDEWYGLGKPSFTLLVFVVGAVIAVIAAAGYEMVARVANIAAPWMIAIFAACGLVSLAQMGVSDWGSLLGNWDSAVGFVQERDPQSFSFWQIVVFAWLCNGAMHFGMADLSIFRFARDKSSGWAPSIGMFLGHYMAWIAAALMLAAAIKLGQQSGHLEALLNKDGKVVANPGWLASEALGWTGILCVIIAGWTTANPTIYRAGLAFQGIFPNSSRVRMTLLAGGVATVAGAFPNLSGQLLGFVGTYGTVLGPMGAVIFVDFYLMRKFGLSDEYATHAHSKFNVAVLLAWALPVAVGLAFIYVPGLIYENEKVFPAYMVIPCWIACGVLYLVLSKFTQRPVPRIDELASN
ncbi:purine-cytosine permease family protein [Aeoliella sp.]|uniref:purine-cytosine permease family protein n=1 Tax=Aeoliella sp. TaxID=2795800 RepID=UPI003CCB86DE